MPHECTNCGRVFDDGSKEMLSGCPNCGGNKFQFRPSSAPDPGEPPNSGEAPPSASPSSTSTAWSGTAKRALDEQEEPDDPSDSAPSESTETSRQWVNQRRDDEAAVGGASQPAGSTGQPAESEDHLTGSSGQPAESEDRSVGTSRESSPGTDRESIEDTAQASARSDVVSPDELPAASARATDPDDDDAVDPQNAGTGRTERDQTRQADTPTATPGDSTTGEDPPADREGPPTDADGRVIEPSSDDRPGLDDLREELNEQFESIRIVAPGEYELNLMELYDRTEYIISLQEDGRYIIEVPDTWDTTPDDSEGA